MKIFVVGGLARSLINFREPLLKALVDQGHSVFTAAGETTADVEMKLNKMGIAHFDIAMDRTGLNPINDIRVFHQLTNLFYTIKPDVTLSYTIKPIIYGSLAAKAVGVPRICSMVEGLGYAFTGSGLKRSLVKHLCMVLYKVTLKNCYALFFLNPDDESLFRENHLIDDNLRTCILNGIGVDLTHYHTMPLPKVTSFLLIARLLRDKGIREYINAARVIKTKYPNILFRLVGSADSNPACIPAIELEQWVREGVVEYLGQLQDVRPAISTSSIYVLPSYYREGTPRTVLEAMSMGRPVITTNSPGCRETVKPLKDKQLDKKSQEVLQGENGFLVPVKNVEKLVEAMEQLITNPQLIEYMGQNSRRIAEEKYDIHQVNRVILETMGL